MQMETEIIKKGFKNTIFVVLAQSVKFLLGIAKALILPIILGVTNFGYWQVYLLYMSYVGIFALGFNDGIYLKYGKYDYDQLPKPIFRSSIKLFIFAQIAITFLISILILFESDFNKQLAMIFASINIPIAGLTGVLIYVLQVTNQLKKYSLYTILDKAIVLVIILLALIARTDQFILIILADIFSKLIVLGLMVHSCRDLIFGVGVPLDKAAKESFDNINIGIKLMLANFSGMLVFGFGKFIVERFESVEVYGTYAFAISTINLVLVFITAVGLVIYPTLSRIDDQRYPSYFKELNKVLNILIFVLLISYFPLRIFIERFMIEYILIFEYLPIIFTVVLVQTKMQILINPFYKLLREEKIMLAVNITGLIMAMILVSALYFTTRSVTMVALSTLIAMGVRLYLSEIYLEKRLGIKGNKGIALEIVGIAIFIFFAYQRNIIIGLAGFSTIIMIYVLTQIKSIEKFTKLFIKG